MAGMSLGGYTTARSTPPSSTLDFACPIITGGELPPISTGTTATGAPSGCAPSDEGITLEMMKERDGDPHAASAGAQDSRRPGAGSSPPRAIVIAPPEHADKLAAHFGGEEIAHFAERSRVAGRPRRLPSARWRGKLAGAGLIERR